MLVAKNVQMAMELTHLKVELETNAIAYKFEVKGLQRQATQNEGPLI